MTRVLIVDDHALFRQGLRSLLENIEGLDIVGEAGDGQGALDLAASLNPDVILMDISMPDFDGLEATGLIKARFPAIKVLVISMHADHLFIRQALLAGASGYIFKGAAFPELKAAIESVIHGAPYISPVLLVSVLEDYINLTPQDDLKMKYNTLTKREKEVFELFVQGLGRQLIGNLLFISPKTVDRHKSNLKEKLGVNNDPEMVNIAKQLNII